MNCPLCKSKNVKMIEIVNKNELNSLYKKTTGIDFSYLITHNLQYFICQECKLRYFNPLITGDEKFYNALQKFDWYYQDEKEEFNIASEYIRSKDRVLEVGSGKGAFVKYLRTKYYTGLDFSENAKKIAAKNGIKIENEYIENYANFHKSEFDVVCSFQVLEHVPNPKSFIESKLKVLNLEGRMIIGVPNDDTFMRYVVNGSLNMPPHHVTRWSKDTFEFIANKYNLDLQIVTEKVQPYHKDWYISTFIRTLLFGKENLIESSLIKKIIVKGIKILLNSFLKKNFKEEFLPEGMVMVGIFTKKY